MKRQGFTLIELLAVIVVLAIIALIAIPLVINTIEEARKGALKDSAYGIIEAGELYYMNNLSADADNLLERYDFEIVNKKFVNTADTTKTLSFKGEMPKTGTLQINNNGSVAIAICNEDYCACKSVSENKVTVTDGSCNISSDTGEIENGTTASSADIDELKKDIEELKKSQGAVTGTVIAYMGNNVPTGYLSCDGKVYNINDYKTLAEQIKSEFGSYNYFGGDGESTFAVPDLRGEFLRGTGTNSHANNGDGAAVGQHQDATEHVTIFSYNGYIQHFADGDIDELLIVNSNRDKPIGTRTTSRYMRFGSKDNNTYTAEDNAPKYTSRPTNTSVLYCIKY